MQFDKQVIIEHCMNIRRLIEVCCSKCKLILNKKKRTDQHCLMLKISNIQNMKQSDHIIEVCIVANDKRPKRMKRSIINDSLVNKRRQNAIILHCIYVKTLRVGPGMWDEDINIVEMQPMIKRSISFFIESSHPFIQNK